MLDLLIERLTHQDHAVRRMAIELMVHLPPDHLVAVSPRLMKSLEDLECSVQEAASDALGQLPAADVVALIPALLALMRENQMGSVREMAVRTLGCLPIEDLVGVTPVLVEEGLTDNKGRVRRASVRALGRLPPEELEKIARQLRVMLEDVEVGVRKLAVKVLATIGQ